MGILEFIRGGLASTTYLIFIIVTAIMCAIWIFKGWRDELPETSDFAVVCAIILIVAVAAHLWALPY